MVPWSLIVRCPLNYGFIVLRPQMQPIYSFHFGVPIWPLFLWWFPISLYYNYALCCKCWEPPIQTFGMFTSDRVFQVLPVTPVLYRTENCNNKSISCYNKSIQDERKWITPHHFVKIGYCSVLFTFIDNSSKWCFYIFANDAFVSYYL